MLDQNKSLLTVLPKCVQMVHPPVCVNINARVCVHVLPEREHWCRWCVGVWLESAMLILTDNPSLIIHQHVLI